MSDTIAAIVAAHRAGTTSPEATITQCYARIRAHDDPAVFISLRDEADAIAHPPPLVGGHGRDSLSSRKSQARARAQRRFKVPRVVVRVADPGRAAWYAEEGLLTICPTQQAIDQAERLVMA